MTTVRDVARRAGVSVATAARALGDYGYVSEHTRRRVLRVARALDYRPNGIARSMIKKRTQTITVIVSDNANPFFASVVRGIEDVLLAHGYGIMLCNADEDPDKESKYVDMVLEKRADGLIISPSGRAAPLRALMARKVPMVQIDRRIDRLRADAVIVDNRAGVGMAIEHLIQLGHRRIGIISGPRRLYTGRERLAAYVETLQAAHIALNADLIQEGDFKEQSGYTLVRQILELRPRPTALFIANNLMTIGALLGLKDAGVRIPQEMAVVGFDDMAWAPILTPPLTAVAQPGYELGATAGRLLTRRLHSSDTGPPETVVLKPRLVVRASCGASQK